MEKFVEKKRDIGKDSESSIDYFIALYISQRNPIIKKLEEIRKKNLDREKASLKSIEKIIEAENPIKIEKQNLQSKYIPQSMRYQRNLFPDVAFENKVLQILESTRNYYKSLPLWKRFQGDFISLEARRQMDGDYYYALPQRDDYR